MTDRTIPNQPRTAKATLASVAARRRNANEKMAEFLRSQGYTVTRYNPVQRLREEIMARVEFNISVPDHAGMKITAQSIRDYMLSIIDDVVRENENC